MHLVRFTTDDQTHLGTQVDDGIIDLGVSDLAEWLACSPDEQQAHMQTSKPRFALDAVKLESPLTHPSKIIAIGLNYLDHCREQGVDPPKEPLVFSKFPSTLIGPDTAITWDTTLTTQVDPEVELGVIIGQRCHNISADHALDSVFGYTVVNDVSARDLQFGDGQWTRGKNLDTFCPIGPVIVTRDAIADPQSLSLRLWVNDRLQQDGTTADMIFSVAQIIAHVSRFATLEPGDLIITGTPWGVGCFRTPPVYLTPGDVVTCEIEGIGTLRNPTHEA